MMISFVAFKIGIVIKTDLQNIPSKISSVLTEIPYGTKI